MGDDPDTCITDYRWMNIQNDGLGDSFNGILGLNADPKAMQDYMSWEAADSYIEELYDAGIIGDKVFAFALRDVDDDDSSYIDVGFYDEDAMDDPNNLVWTDVAYDYLYGQFWWQHYMTGIRFRDQVSSSSGVSYSDSIDSVKEYGTTSESILAIVDSGTSCLILSYNVYEFVIE
jgi:hypothetical protein